jgi:Glu-tRNA(Gln) amidotransferase subunit E-like FAD-binding protein
MKVVDARNALAFSDFAPIRQALDRGEMVAAVRLPGLGGLLAHRTQPGVTFAREIADRIRVIACPEHQPFMVHSDLADFGLESHHWRALGNQLRTEPGDAMVVVWAAEQDCATAVRETFIRAQDALVGIPPETRQAFPDGTNGFERILPGPDRMYPDTDTPPLPIAEGLVEQIRATLPETPWEREDRYQGLGLEALEAQQLARAPWGWLYDELSPEGGAVAIRLARALAKRFPHHRRTGKIGPGELVGGGGTADADAAGGSPSAAAAPGAPAAPFLAARLDPLVRALEEDQIRLEATEQILDHLVTDRVSNPYEILDRYRMTDSDLDDLTAASQGVVEMAQTELRMKTFDVAIRWGIGRLMQRFLGRLDPVLVRAGLEEALAAAGWQDSPQEGAP